MADIAKTLEKYKELLFDRAKYFKSEYETLPIPNLDISYFQKLNTADLMEYNPILGAIFIPYKHDIYILEQENVGKFFVREAGKENKVMKRISILNSNVSEISTIKLSKCLHMLAVIAGKEIRVYLVKNMLTETKAVLVDTFVGEKSWRTLQWAPRKSETSDDVLLAIDEEQKLFTFNLKTKEKKSCGDQAITCATFSSDGDHIFAVTTKNEFIVFKAPSLEVKTLEKVKFIEDDEFFAKTVLSHIEEIKKDLWLFSGAVDDDDSNPIQCSKHTYMIQGDLVNKNINDCPAQLFNEMFLHVFGVNQATFKAPYYKHIYIPQRDVIVSGCTLAADCTAIINRNPKNPSNDIEKYEGFEMGVEQNIKLAAPGGVTGFFRGMVFYRNKFAPSDSFDYNENDEEKSMAYPPFIFVLTSTGQIGKYAFLLMRSEYQDDSLLIKTEGVAGLKRNISVSSGAAPAKPTITQPQQSAIGASFMKPASQQPTFSFAGATTTQPAATVAAQPTITEVVPANVPNPAEEGWKDTDIAKTLEKYKELLFDRAKYFKSEYETLPIPNLDMKYFQKLNTADIMEHNPILGAIFIPYKQDIYILEQENVGKFFVREAGKENKIMKCIKVLAPTDPEISMIKLSKCFNMIAVLAGKDLRVYLVKNMFTEGKAALVECWTGEKNWKTLQWAPRKSETSDDMLLGIDEENKLTAINLKTKEGKRWSKHAISCATFSSDGEHIFAVTTKNEFIVFKSSTMQVVKIEFIRFVEEDNFDITVFTQIQEIKKDLWLLSGAVDDDSTNPIQCSKHTFMIQGDILNKKINELPAQLYNEMFLHVFGVNQPNFEPAYYKHLYIPQRDVIVSGCTLAADCTAIINRNPKNPSNDIAKYEGFEMGVEQNIKLAAPAGVTGFFRGMVFYNNKFAQVEKFDYNENDEEKSMAYPPFIFVLTSTGQIGKYAFLLMRSEYQDDSLLIKTEGLSGLKRNIPVSTGIATKPALPQQPVIGGTTQPTQGSSIFQAPLKKPDLGTGIGTGTGLGIGGGASILNKQQPLVNNQTTLQPKPTTGLGIDNKPQATPQQTSSEGTFDPIAAKMNDTKANIMKKIDSLTSYTDLINNVKQIFPKLTQKDKEFYEKEIQVQKTLHECQTFFKSLGLLLVEQEASRKKLESLIKSVDNESDAIRCIIEDEIIEGKEMNIYQNSELRQQVRKCEGQLKFFGDKIDYIEDFIDNYSTIYEERPTAAPEVIIGSPIKQLEERSNTIYHSFKNDDENSTSLYLTPMSSILRMSRSSKAPVIPSSKPQQKTMNNISLTTSVMMNKSQGLRTSAAAAVPQTNISSKNSYVRPAASLRATQLDSEYTRQLVQLNSKFNEALDHTQHKLTEIRRELQVLNRSIDKSAVKKQENTPAQKLSESFIKKQKRGIFFNPDSDSDNEEELNRTVVQTQQGLFDQILGQSKAAKTTTIKIPLHKHKQGGYNGPQLSAILSKFDDLLSGKQTLNSLPKVSVPQPIVQKTTVAAPAVTEKKPLIGGGLTQQQPQVQAPKVQAPSSTQPTTNIDGLKNKETGLLNFTTKPAQEEDKKVPAPQKPLLQPKEEVKTNEKPAASTGGLFGNPPKTQAAQPEEKKVDTKPETKPGGLFAGGSSIFGSKPTQPTTEKKELSDSSALKTGPVPEDRKIKTLIKPGSQTQPLAPLNLKSPGEESGYKDEDDSVEKVSESSGTDLTEEEKDQVTPPPVKKNDLKPIKSILGNLSDLDKIVSKPQKSGQKPLLESILKDSTADDDNIPAPVLVRDDSYIQPKSLEGPKVDFFKTMTGKPSFLQNKPEKPQESREDVAAKLKEALPKPGENITLFSKKVEAKEPEKEAPKKSEPEQPKETKAPEGSSLDALNKGFLDEALFGSAPTEQQQNQPKPQAPVVQENKPVVQQQSVNTNLFNQPKNPAPATNTGAFAGLNLTKPSGPALFTGAAAANTTTSGTTNMFASNQNQGQTGLNFGQQANPGANRFAIGGGNTQQQTTAPANPAGVGQAGFGARQLPSFGNTGQPTTNFGQHGGAMFGQHSSGGFGQQQLQKPIVQSSQKMFGSQSKMFGSGTTGSTGTASTAGSTGGSTNFFGSAVSSGQSGSSGTSFFGNAMSQNTNAAPLNFLGGSGGASGGAGAGAGANMMGSVRKTKQV